MMVIGALPTYGLSILHKDKRVFFIRLYLNNRSVVLDYRE